nr:KinB-signaling pathway activation protein [Neobacillus thermocopriae]
MVFNLALEVYSVTSRNWVKLFLTTSLVGGLTTAIVGLIVRWSELQQYFVEFQLLDMISAIVWLIFMGFLISVISQMGFFSYLTIHRFGLGIFKSPSLWNGVQVVLILFALFDLVYLRYENFAESGESVLTYLFPAFILLFVGIITAWLKVKQTNRQAFIPALFFMIVVTIVEWVPVLRENSTHWLYLMLAALLACNAYQLLILPKLNEKSQEERQKRVQHSGHKGKKPRKLNKKPSI